MKRFKLTYNGVTAIFNGVESGRSGSSCCGSVGIHYTVRPSKTNLLNISKLIHVINTDGTENWHFYTRNPKGTLPRGLKVTCEII